MSADPPRTVLPAFDFSRLARRQLHIFLMLDTSGSMQGNRIASLNYSIRAALPELRKVSAENPEIDVRLRALSFSTGVQWTIEAPTPVDQIEWRDVEAQGETALGLALQTVAGQLTEAGLPGRQLPPLLVLVSDGYPSDDFEGGMAALQASRYGAAAVRIGIAIGARADEEILEKFIQNPALKPLHANNADQLARQIKWATTAPVKAVSSPKAAPDQVALLARDPLYQPAPVSDVIW